MGAIGFRSHYPFLSVNAMKEEAFTKLRPTKLRFYLRCMEKFGFSPREVLAGTGLEPTLLEDRFALVPVPLYMRAVSNMLKLTKSQELAFNLGKEIRIADLGILGHAVCACDNVAHAYPIWQKYNWLFFGTFFSASEYRDETSITFEFIPRIKLAPHLLQFFIEEKINIDVALFRRFNNCEINTRLFTTTYPAPPHAYLYQNLLNCKVVFGSGKITYVIDHHSDFTSKPFNGADSETLEVCLEYLDKIANVVYRHTTFSEKVRFKIKELLPVVLSLDEMAAELHMTRRTFSRSLVAENTSYQKLLMEVKIETAQTYLSTTSLSTDEIAYKLGFLNTTSLRRAFKQSTGLTISEFKESPHLVR
ncbi:MAG: AraC family transcriptional regulator ligand-binding domain-containing protein [Porticoccaceae bacterium]